MTKQLDDLEAVRTLVSTLEAFDKADQERIIRWAREKLGLPLAGLGTPPGQRIHAPPQTGETPSIERSSGGGKNIKSFVAEKKPCSDNQFAATIAYYYRFEAPEAERKDAITAEHLQDACRTAGRDRLKNPGQTLINAHNVGLLDKAERGAYAINSVGENLVAMTLPGEAATSSGAKRRIKRKAKTKKKLTKGKVVAQKLSSN